MDEKDELAKRWTQGNDETGSRRQSSQRRVFPSTKKAVEAMVRCLAYESLADILRGCLSPLLVLFLKSSSSFRADVGYLLSTQAWSREICLQLPDICFLA